MFSSVLDKVVSTTAPGTLATFPPRADLPASSSTLCCLSFVDRFISRYTTAVNTAIEGDIDGRLLLGRAGRPAGIAISADDLEATMESAAELGGRLAAALAGTVRSKRSSEPATAPVPDLLAKVRGIFGNRLTCVGREIRVSRNEQAERDETLLLRQIHTLKNAALDACNGEKWSIVVSSGGESLAVCCVPLPAVEEGGACGCDFLIFDPWPRPAMKLRGSYIVKFTTVRGLQLHLLSALGEIWRGGGLLQENGSRKEFVGLSVVMTAKGKGEEQVDVDSRRLLEDSVTNLRKAEKAAAIKMKREEVEALRRALKKPAQQKQLIPSTPRSGSMFGVVDGTAELQQGGKDSDLHSGPASSSHRSAQSYRELEVPREIANRSTYGEDTSSPCDGAVEPLSPNREAIDRNPVAEPAQHASDSAAPHFGLTKDEQSQSHHREVSSSRDSSVGRPKLRPPVADISPPLSTRRSEREEGRRRWSEEDGELDPVDRGYRPDLGGTLGTTVTGGVVGASTPGGREVAPLASEHKDIARVEGVERGTGHRGVDDSIYPKNCPDQAVISDNPLHRALLRSIEGEGLAEYSKRAYSVYRTHGVIQDESEPDEYRAPGSTAYDLSSSANQLYYPPTLSPPAGHMGMEESPAIISHGDSSSTIGPADDLSMGKVGRKECGPVGVGVREPVRPFSPPPSSPQTLGQSEGEHLSSSGWKTSAAAAAPASDHDLRVIDLSEAEDVASNKPDKPASPPEGFRSRIRAPRAGRALALASANARSNPGCRQDERSPGFRRDVSGSELLPPPPPAMTTTVLTRRKEAWTEDGQVIGQQLEDLHVRKGRHEPGLACSRARGGTAEIVSDEDDDELLERSGAVLKKPVAPSEARDGRRRPSRQQENSKQARKEQVGGDIGRKSHQGESTAGMEPGRHGNSDKNSGGERTYDEKQTSKARSSYRPTAVDGCIPVSTPAAGNSPRSKADTTLTTKTHRRRGDRIHSHVPCLVNVSGRKSPMNTVLVEPSLLDTGVVELHRSRNDKTGDVEPTEEGGLGETGKALDDNEEFVWFGQPDTPLGRQSAEDETTRGVDKEGETAVAVRTAAEVQSCQNYSPRRQQRSKARLVLQMEVRRQRDIIEQAFQAREEEGRLRRARIGAEVLKRIQGLLHRRSCSPPEAQTAPSHSRPVQQPTLTRPEPSNNADQARKLQVAAHRAEETTVTSPSHPEIAVKAWGFPPAIVDHRVENPAVKAVQPEVLVPDITPSEGAVTVGRVSAADNLAPEPQPKRVPGEVAAADNPWGRVVSRQQAELESHVPVKTEPMPPPISFDVEANAFRDGAGRLDGGTDQEKEQEKARRQARYEALRARKMAEAEERRRGQRERQAAARVEQRRQSAAAAAAAAVAAAATAVTADEEQHGQDTKNGPQRQNLAQYGSTVVDASLQRNNAPGKLTARPRSSSQPNSEDRFARQGVSALGDSKGSIGGGGTRLPAPGAGRIASPAVRGYSRRSNRKLVRNAINFLCLAGGHLEEKKTRALEALDSHPASNFVVLLAHTKLLSFKGLYACSGEEDGTAGRVFGLGPPQVDATMASGFYKYNSAAREFREVHSKTLGKTTDAVSMEPTRLKRPKGLAVQ